MQTLLNGLISGAAISLLAVAFQAVYLPTRIFFLGLAAIYSLAPYLLRMGLNHGTPWLLALSLTVPACVGLSLFFEWANHGRLAKRGASEGAHLIASLGLYIATVQVIAMTFGNEAKTLRAGLDVTLRLGGLVVTGAQFTILVVTILLLGGFAVFLMFTDMGLRLRALADNPVQFAILGYNVDRHRTFAFGLAGLFASVSSLCMAYDIGFDPYTGLNAVLLAVIATIVGGGGSFLGPVIGALFIGLVRAQIVWYFSGAWQEPITYFLLATFLLLRPRGLLGRKTCLEISA